MGTINEISGQTLSYCRKKIMAQHELEKLVMVMPLCVPPAVQEDGELL